MFVRMFILKRLVRRQMQYLQNPLLLSLQEMAQQVAREQVEGKGQVTIEFMVIFNVTLEGHEDAKLAAVLTFKIGPFTNFADVAGPQCLWQIERGQNEIFSDFVPKYVRFVKKHGTGFYQVSAMNKRALLFEH